MHDAVEVNLAIHLFRRHEMTPLAVSRLTGIPRSTLRDWHAGRLPRRDQPLEERLHRAPCDIDLDQFDPPSYCYLLGMYLGDGCISAYKRSLRLRITLDSRYPGIIDECVKAMNAISGKQPVIHKRSGSNCVEVSAYWPHWPCVFPQHGPGRKHLRPIVLTEQQKRLVTDYPRAFIRGLIHSDGTRIIAVERKGNAVRRAPRYAFSNMSNDILNLFTDACDCVGIRYTQPSYKQIAVYRKASVAAMDEFVGPKS